MSRFRLLPLASALTIINMVATMPIMAKTFYVDAINGNDAWSGELADPVANNGPWQTLANLNAATLAPGDSAFLRCGQTWAETLKIKGAGLLNAPIRIGSYPSTCTDKPGISGFKAIPAHAWEVHNGQIYKVKLPYNPIQNGSAANNITGWRRYSKDNSAVIAYEPVCPDSATGCLKITSGSVTRQANLAISPPFPLEASKGYEAKISVRIPAGARYAILVRRNGPTYETLGLSVPLGGTGGWQHLRLPFNSTRGVSNARIDVEFYDIATNLYIKDANVTSTQTSSPVILTASGEQVILAHHPNAGIDPSRPQSIYFNTTAPSTIISVNGKTASPDIVAGSLVLPAGATITPGQKVHVRTAGWRVDEHTVTGVSGTRITFEPPTAYPLFYPKWGYFFTGALWMLDSPGEWHFNPSDSSLYLWRADSGAPASSVRYAALDKGIDLINGKFVTIEGLRIEGARLGVDMHDAQNITLRDLEIGDTLENGIQAIGVIDSVIESSLINRTGGDAIYAPYSSNLRIAHNDIRNNGVILKNGLVANLPKTVYAAIRSGTNSGISDNRIENAAYIGIWTDDFSQVSRNAVLNVCTVLNDCGGIYLPTTSANTNVSNNILDTGVGNTDGLYPTLPAHAAGLYFDEHAHDILAAGNTVTNHSYGAQIHNSWNITLDGNTFHGNRTNQLLMQEQRNSAFVNGDTHDNVVRNNRFFPLNEANAVYLLSVKTTTDDFGLFEGNLYSNFYSPIVLVENQPGNIRTANTLYDWQTASNNGTPRNQDINARVMAPKPGYALGMTGTSVVWNGDFSSGKSSWSSSSSAPAPVLAIEDCSPGPSRCLAVTAGGGNNTAVGTPRFSINKQLYRISFDIRADQNNTPLWIVVRRAGTTSYAYLMPASVGVTAGTQWKRYSFNFTSTAKVTANEAPGVLGARVDFEQIPTGRKIWLANVEMNPLSLPNGNAINTSTLLLKNPEQSSLIQDCPLRDTQPASCGNFVDFDSGNLITWPTIVDPLTSKIIFLQDLSLPDVDQDGISDSQDQCLATPTGRTVNAKGCMFGE